ncbi:hypothetical protein [Lysinibacillus capsici]|uniref:hypothetical protein n=1 Tax=Lysinibacillus capsici TaxID=2115968 RepID=UPI003BAC2084
MIKFGMFNSINGDRRYKAEDFAQYFATFIGNGIFVKPSDCLQIFANGDSMSVTVRAGKAWVNGYYLVNDDNYTLPLSVGDTTLNRIDRIVIRLDFVQRKMSVEVKKGTLSASPVAPTLKRDADAYELALADVYIAKGALTINQAAVTDTRLNNTLCGLMHGVVNQVDTTTIFNQYQQWFNDYSVTKAAEFLAWQTDVTTALENWIDAQEKDFEAWRQAEEQLYYTWLNGKKNDFDTWFATVRDKLSEDAAGNLFNLIDEHKHATLPHKYKDAADGQTYLWGMQRNSTLNAAAFMYAPNEVTSPNVINLPTWEQVNTMQTEIINTSGRLAAKNGNMYKIKTVDDRSILMPEGSSNLNALVLDYQNRFPLVAPNVGIENNEKWHVRDEVYVIIHTYYIIIFDLAAMKVLNAVSIASLGNTNFTDATSIINYFVDDKYLYIRGRNNLNAPSFGVFNKTTGAWVTGISAPGNNTAGVSVTTNLGAIKLPCIGGVFFLTAGSGSPYIIPFAIDYDTNGIPQSFTSKLVHPTAGGSYIQYAIFDDGQFIYDIYVANSSLWYLRKSQYNKSNNTWTTIAVGTNTSTAPVSNSSWWHVYVKGAITFAVIKQAPNQSVFVVRLDTLQQYQVIANNMGHRQPTFDYTNKNKMWMQYHTVGTVPVYFNGNYYEIILELTMNNNATWSSQYHWVPINHSPGLDSPTRRIHLGQNSIMKNGELLVRNDAAYSFLSAKLKPVKIIEGYQV